MKIVCAWCGKYMGEKEGGDEGEISHGVCEECSGKFLKELDEEDRNGTENTHDENNESK